MKTTETSIQPVCLRTEIRKEFVRRCKLNPSYSMRAYASFLEMDQSLLSKIMNGQREISRRMVEVVAFKLKIKPAQLAMLRETGSSTATHEYIQILDDEVNILSDWTHFAILELAKTKSFKLDKKWIASRFGVRPEQIEEALERLERMKMIEIKGTKLKLLRVNNDWTNTAATTMAKKELQRIMLELSQKSLEATPFEEREHGSLTIAIRKSRMPEFKQKLKQIRDELDVYFQPESDAAEFDEVYQLAMSLFPLTQKLKINTKEKK